MRLKHTIVQETGIFSPHLSTCDSARQDDPRCGNRNKGDFQRGQLDTSQRAENWCGCLFSSKKSDGQAFPVIWDHCGKMKQANACCTECIQPLSHFNLSYVICDMSHVTCHMSLVTCHMSQVMCHMSHVVFSMSLDMSCIVQSMMLAK